MLAAISPTPARLVPQPAPSCHLQQITPKDPTRRGCQLSLRVLPPADKSKKPVSMRELEHLLMSHGVATDAREVRDSFVWWLQGG